MQSYLKKYRIEFGDVFPFNRGKESKKVKQELLEQILIENLLKKKTSVSLNSTIIGKKVN